MVNRYRFWTGISMGAVEVLALAGFGLTLVDWTWLTAKLVLSIGIILAIVLYNVIAGILVWFGSERKK